MKMTSSSAIVAVAVVASLLPALLLACDNVPTMTMDDACLKSCPTQPLYQRCHATLLEAPASAEVTIYAIVAAKIAQLSYESSSEEVDRLAASVAGDERAAYAACKERYASARRLMVSVQNQLFGCLLVDVRQELIDATVAVRACGDGLWKFTASPLYARNADDMEKTMVAYELGSLIVGR